MKKIPSTAAFAFFAILTLNLDAQTTPTPQAKTNNLEIGFNVSQYHNDFGLGVHLISPYFFYSTLAVRAGANVQWFEHLKETEMTWSAYQNFQLGIRSRSVIVNDRIFIYGEGGGLVILPNSDFSSESEVFGGYGLFGFEFKPAYNFSYFIELGGIGTGATADKIPGKPIYSNGFLMNVGFRIGL